jgi:hypothetical protein
VIRPTLAQTLIAQVEGATPAHPAITVEEAEIALPLIVTLERGREGPVLRAQPPFSAYRSGIEPVAHPIRIRITQTAPQDAATGNPAATDPGG